MIVFFAFFLLFLKRALVYLDRNFCYFLNSWEMCYPFVIISILIQFYCYISFLRFRSHHLKNNDFHTFSFIFLLKYQISTTEYQPNRNWNWWQEIVCRTVCYVIYLNISATKKYPISLFLSNFVTNREHWYIFKY